MNSWDIASLALVTLTMLSALIQQHLHHKLRASVIGQQAHLQRLLQWFEDESARIAAMENRIGQLEKAAGENGKAIDAIWAQLDLTEPEELERQDLAARLSEQYRSLGFIVDNDEMSRKDLEALEDALLTLRRVDVRRESDTEVDRDARLLLGPDATDRVVLPTYPLAPKPHDPTTPWSRPPT